MAFIGNSVENQGFSPAVDYYNGDGTTVTYTLSRPVASVAQLTAVIENVIQNPSTAFTVSGNSITFTSAPPSGTNNIWVEYTSLITTYAALSQDPSVIGDITATGGYLSTGDFGNTYVDGTIVDYVTGNARITTGPSDGITLYNGGTSARNILAAWDATGNLTAPQAIKLSYSANSNYASDAAISNYSSTNGVYVNGNAAGWLRLSNDGTNSTKINLNGSSYSTPNQIEMFTAGTERMRIDASGNLAFNSGYGSVATAYGCRAWVNFGSDGTIRSSGNVSSVTRNTTGDFSINFTNAMPDTNYSAAMSMRRGGTNDVLFACPFGVSSGTAFATGSLRIRVFNQTPSAENPDTGCVQIFR